MSLSGPDALRSLEEALRDVRREEDELAKRLAKSAELVARIQQSESELLRQLATVRLDPATQAELTGRLSKAEHDAREVLKQHQEAMGVAEHFRTTDGIQSTWYSPLAEAHFQIEAPTGLFPRLELPEEAVA